MRVLIALAALVTIPFAVSVAQGQGQGHDAAHCAARTAKFPTRDINKCPPPAPTPPPPVQPPPVQPPPVEPPPVVPPVEPPACAVSSSLSGSLSITGRVQDAVTGNGLANWCVTITEVTGLGSATAVTDASGNYSFAGVPDGEYLTCEVLKTGWQQTFPTVVFGGVSCPSGLGWDFPLWGMDASFVNFKNSQ
jgi:carboxypeptidase family protein